MEGELDRAGSATGKRKVPRDHLLLVQLETSEALIEQEKQTGTAERDLSNESATVEMSEMLEQPTESGNDRASAVGTENEKESAITEVLEETGPAKEHAIVDETMHDLLLERQVVSAATHVQMIAETGTRGAMDQGRMHETLSLMLELWHRQKQTAQET